MTEQGRHNWQHLEPSLEELDRELRSALKGSAARADLADEVFEATADQVMAGDLAEPLRASLAVSGDGAPSAELASRIAGVTTPGQRMARSGRPSVLAKLGSFAVAAAFMLAVGLAVHFGSSPEGTTPQTAPSGSGPAIALEDPLDTIAWAYSRDDEFQDEVSAIAADLDYLADRESDAAIEDELTRQLYYYELAEASFASQ
ncbi:MAG: hypothetical protein WD294_09965 [Phycisphaeraceae bacterium]